MRGSRRPAGIAARGSRRAHGRAGGRREAGAVYSRVLIVSTDTDTDTDLFIYLFISFYLDIVAYLYTYECIYSF